MISHTGGATEPQLDHSLFAARTLLRPGGVYATPAVRTDGSDRRLAVYADHHRLAYEAVEMSAAGLNVSAFLDPVAFDFASRRDLSRDGPEWSGGCLGPTDFFRHNLLPIRVSPAPVPAVLPAHSRVVTAAELAATGRDALRAAWNVPAPCELVAGDDPYSLYWVDMPAGDRRYAACLRPRGAGGVFGAAEGPSAIAPRPVPWPGTVVRPTRGSAAPAMCELTRAVNAVATRDDVIDLFAGCVPVPDFKPPRVPPAVAPPPGFDLGRFVATHLPDALGPFRQNGGWSWLLPVCPWNLAHADAPAHVGERSDRDPYAGCRPPGCPGESAKFADLFGLLDHRVPPPGTPPPIVAARARKSREPRRRGPRTRR